MAHWHHWQIRLCIHCQSSTRAPSKYYSCFSTKTERRLLSTTTLPEDLISLTPVLLSDHVHGPIWLKSSVKGNFLRIMCRKLVRLKHIFWIYDELEHIKPSTHVSAFPRLVPTHHYFITFCVDRKNLLLLFFIQHGSNQTFCGIHSWCCCHRTCCCPTCRWCP